MMFGPYFILGLVASVVIAALLPADLAWLGLVFAGVAGFACSALDDNARDHDK